MNYIRCCITKGRGVRLCTFPNSSLCGRVKEKVRVIGGILGLDQTTEFGVFRGFLAEYRVAEGRWVCGEVLETRQFRTRKDGCNISATPTGGVFFST